MTFSITPLGCSAMYATADMPASGYLVDLDGFKLWLEAGGGTWQQLLHHVDFAELDGILLTHRHPDHTIDMFQLFHARLYGERDLPNIPLWAPGETIARATAFSTELGQTFDIVAIEGGGVIDIGGAKASFVEMKHSVETCGVRLESGGSVLAYTADTGPNSDFQTLARDADVLFCEATYQDSDQPWWEGHMSATQAGRLITEVGGSRLVLTHLPPTRDHQVSLDEAKRECGSASVELAVPGRTVEVTR